MWYFSIIVISGRFHIVSVSRAPDMSAVYAGCYGGAKLISFKVFYVFQIGHISWS